jgi:hypothetical protein
VLQQLLGESPALAAGRDELVRLLARPAANSSVCPRAHPWRDRHGQRTRRARAVRSRTSGRPKKVSFTWRISPGMIVKSERSVSWNS